jgi:hypothetical protein
MISEIERENVITRSPQSLEVRNHAPAIAEELVTAENNSLTVSRLRLQVSARKLAIATKRDFLRKRILDRCMTLRQQTRHRDQRLRRNRHIAHYKHHVSQTQHCC